MMPVALDHDVEAALRHSYDGESDSRFKLNGSTVFAPGSVLRAMERADDVLVPSATDMSSLVTCLPGRARGSRTGLGGGDDANDFSFVFLHFVAVRW
jgi:hypothetical protein